MLSRKNFARVRDKNFDRKSILLKHVCPVGGKCWAAGSELLKSLPATRLLAGTLGPVAAAVAAAAAAIVVVASFAAVEAAVAVCPCWAREKPELTWFL